MKRFSLIFLGALAILMAGCSKNNPQQPDPDAWVHDLSLPVPIQFGSPLPVTKAVGFVDASDLEGIDIGVYGLDKSADAVWNLQDLTSGDVILANKKGTITQGSIDLEGGPYYYPRVSEKNYTFYGYYPKTSPTTSDGGGLYVNVPLVNTDVLWSRAEAKGDGYNAMYLRKIRSGLIDDEVPTFNFEHSTTGLKFIAKANLEGGIHNDDDFTTTKITKVRVLDVYHNGQLCVAHQTNKALEGTIRPIGEKSNAKIEELDESVGLSPTGAGTELGELFLYADPDLTDGFTVEVVVQTKAWSEYVFSFTTGPVEPKTQYTFNLTFNYEDPINIRVGELSWTGGTEVKDVNTSGDITGSGDSD